MAVLCVFEPVILSMAKPVTATVSNLQLLQCAPPLRSDLTAHLWVSLAAA
jgi:hypothetical protein